MLLFKEHCDYPFIVNVTSVHDRHAFRLVNGFEFNDKPSQTWIII